MAPRFRRRDQAPASGAVRRRRLPLRYLLPSLVLVALMAMLMLRGFVHSEILADYRINTPAANDRVPQEVLKGGPVIDTRRDGTDSRHELDHRMVQPFNVGPHPEWNPHIPHHLHIQ